MRIHQYYVYILTNWNNHVLYTGVTNDLERRLYEHRHVVNEGFSKRYNTHKLVYYADFHNIEDAIAYEKTIKGWTRAKKNALIEEQNPYWKDLSADWPEWIRE